MFGFNLYFTGSLHLRIANQQALLSCHDFTLWENVITFKDSLLEDFKQEFAVILDDGKLIARAALHGN